MKSWPDVECSRWETWRFREVNDFERLKWEHYSCSQGGREQAAVGLAQDKAKNTLRNVSRFILSKPWLLYRRESERKPDTWSITWKCRGVGIPLFETVSRIHSHGLTWLEVMSTPHVDAFFKFQNWWTWGIGSMNLRYRRRVDSSPSKAPAAEIQLCTATM